MRRSFHLDLIVVVVLALGLAGCAKQSAVPERQVQPVAQQETQAVQTQTQQQATLPATASALRHTMQAISGQDVDLSQYHGRVVMIVNVASKCGYTPQYADLQALHEKYAARGLSILAFPCNQFGGQEPGSAEQIADFCRVNYGVDFDLFAKIEVNGEGAAPLYAYLTGPDCPVDDRGPVKWNFEKFLLDRDGRVIARYRSKVKPTDAQVVAAIEAALGEASP